MDFTVLAIAAAFTLAALLTALLWPQRRIWWISRTIPGPRGFPLIGNVLAVQGDMHHLFNVIVDFCKTYGTLYCFWLGPRLFVVVNDPVDVQEVIGNPRIVNRDKMVTKTILPFFGAGLLASRGERWRRHRKIMTPSFHFKILLGYVDVFGRKAGELCDKLDRFAVAGGVVDVHKYLSMCALESICETAIGINVDAERGSGSKFYQELCKCCSLGHERTTKPWLMLDWIFPFTSNGRETAKIHKVLFDFTDSIVAKKLEEYRKKQYVPVDSKPDEEEGRKKIKTLLELVIESSESEGSAMTVKELKDQLTTIAATGFDTTAISISNLCLLLGLNPLVQDEISRELDGIFKGDLRAATMEDISRMEYLDRVIKESLRLLPVAPTLLREISEDVVLASGQVIPAGCTTLTFSYMVHRDPRYFPDPDRFEPDRWLPSEPVTGSSDSSSSRRLERHPYCYLPFSAGPRNCIGQKYAVLQMKSIVSSLLRRFTVTHRFTNDDLKKMRVSMAMEFCEVYEMKLTRK